MAEDFFLQVTAGERRGLGRAARHGFLAMRVDSRFQGGNQEGECICYIFVTFGAGERS